MKKDKFELYFLIFFLYLFGLLIFTGLYTNWLRYRMDLETVVLFIIMVFPISAVVFVIFLLSYFKDSKKLKKISIIVSLIGLIAIGFIRWSDNYHSTPYFYFNLSQTSKLQVLNSSFGNIEYFVKIYNPGSITTTGYINIKKLEKNYKISLDRKLVIPGIDNINFKVSNVLYETADPNVYILELHNDNLDFYKIDLVKLNSKYLKTIEYGGGGCGGLEEDVFDTCVTLRKKLFINNDQDDFIMLGMGNKLDQNRQVRQDLYLSVKLKEIDGYFFVPLNVTGKLFIDPNEDFEDWGKITKVDGSLVYLTMSPRMGANNFVIDLKGRSAKLIK